jgi:SAM-dependent methyltransferase
VIAVTRYWTLNLKGLRLMKCRHCRTELSHVLVDLGSSPPSNSYLNEQTIKAPETWYPLKVMVCDRCWLVQTEDFVGSGVLFSEDYPYFSSFSSSWLQHAKNYVESMVGRFNLGTESMVVEVAANDGYLLQYVIERGIPCCGIEPTHSTAQAAKDRGVDIIESFFGVATAELLLKQGHQADLMVANNVLAHVPDINDFVKGFSILLKPHGVATFEFPHLLNLIEKNQFDTIYHEHYSYLSLTSVRSIFEANGLTIFDVDELPTHGGSLRVYAQCRKAGKQPLSLKVQALQEREDLAGMRNLTFYKGFQGRVEKIKMDFLAFLVDARQQGKIVVGYGAAAKGNTLMNFAGIRPHLVSFVVDRNPAKQGKSMPGSRIPICDEARLHEVKPDYVIIFPWNIEAEIIEQLGYIREWKGMFVVPMPALEVL